MSMADRKPLSELLEKLAKLQHGKVLKKYISHIRFPRFKNISPGARIDFEYPITAFVGPNGSGKTSALHALYGAPKGMSTSEFWFATAVDPIEEGQGEPNRYIYGHWLDSAQRFVETRKARVAKVGKPDYFEPTKTVSSDGMESITVPEKGLLEGQDKDRWNPVDRDVLYINFRNELSAFDKYLFFGLLRATPTLKSKRHRLRAWADSLKPAFDSGSTKETHRGRVFVKSNRLLTADELADMSFILGKEYIEARIVKHSLFGQQLGVSVRFITKIGSTYSEAFAGSGELAIASLVTQLHDAKESTLVLLDEPEVSLHPGAQKRMVAVLAEQVLKKKHQVIFTTHSASLVEHLPPKAIKVFVENADGRFDIINESHPFAAFNRLGAPLPGKLRVLVEDRLAKEVVDRAIRESDLADLVASSICPAGLRPITAREFRR
jgi:energy-coupling factor transporter ATP-binding protein EcfA2